MAGELGQVKDELMVVSGIVLRLEGREVEAVGPKALYHRLGRPIAALEARTGERKLLPAEPARSNALYGLAPYSAACWYASIGGQAHTRCRSPYTLSTRATGGQYLSARVAAVGKKAWSLG